MREGQGFLEWLAGEINVEYLSDLRRPERSVRGRLAWLLADVPAEAATLKEWNEAGWYLLELPPANSGAEAREQLLRELNKTRDGRLSK